MIQAHRITAQDTRTTTADTTAAPTLHLMSAASTVVEVAMAAAVMEEEIDDDPSAYPCAAANPAIALRLHSHALVGRVAELGSLGGTTRS